MKHFNARIILLTLLMCMVGTKVSAADIAVQNGDGKTIYYNFINDGTELEVTKVPINGESYTGAVVIPESVIYEGKTLKVTCLGEEAFYNCWYLTAITIPNGVTRIREQAFYSCRALTTITIPQSVTCIEKLTFNGCSSLATVIIDDAATSIGRSAFSECKTIVSVELGNNVTSIGEEAFYGCNKLPSITIPNSVTEIGDRAFYSCSALTEVISYIMIPFDIPRYTCNDEDAYRNATLYVPKGTLELYKACEGWKRFKNIVEMAGEYCYLTLKYAETGCMKLLVKRGTSQTIAIEPEEGWGLVSVTYNDEDVTSSLDENNHFTTPVITDDAVLRAVYDLETQVKSVANEDFNVKAVEGGLWIDGAKENTVCQVFAVDGKLEKTFRITNSRTFIHLNDGQVYILKVGDKTLKAVF